MNDLELKNSVINESLKYANNFLSKLTEPALNNLGGIIGDWCAYWRLTNLVKILKKVDALFEKNNINTQKINLKTLIPLIEYSSLEEDEDLSNKWAALLVNAANPETCKNIKPAFMEFLKELSPIEAKILDNFYDETMKISKEERYESGAAKEDIIKAFNLSSEEYEIIIDNLFRLNLCMPPVTQGGFRLGTNLRVYDFVFLTPLGIAFIKACKFET